MRRRFIATVLTLLGASTMALAAAAVPAQAAGASKVHSNANWNGYVLPGNAGAVTATWTVPADNCHGSPLFSPASDNIWLGLGGIKIGSEMTPLVQIGTSSECDYSLQGFGIHVKQNDTVVYEVVYPDGSGSGLVKGQSLSAGDKMYSFVEYEGQGEYIMYIEDITRGWHWLVPYSVTDTRTPASAEWIVESGVILPGSNFGNREMARFGTATFGSMSFETAVNGTVQGLTDSDVARLQAGSPPQTHVLPISGNSGVIKWNALY
jgi:hypothetical protein